MGDHTAAEDISGILTATGLQAYLEACRKQEMAAYDALHEAAVRLRKGIEKSGSKWAMGLDVKWAARKICKPIDHAANLHLEAAIALRVSWEYYCGTIGAPKKGKVGSGTFDPSK